MNEVEPLFLTKPNQIWMYSMSFNDNKSHKLIKFKLKMSFPSSSLYSLVIRRDKKQIKLHHCKQNLSLKQQLQQINLELPTRMNLLGAIHSQSFPNSKSCFLTETDLIRQKQNCPKVLFLCRRKSCTRCSVTCSLFQASR